MTQIERIIHYIDEHGSITPMDAFMDLGITKLATQISRMIRMGWPIKKTMKKDFNRWGEPVHFMSYSWLEGEHTIIPSATIYQKDTDVSINCED